ncbi:TetR/AcrR family transcriptional regulator [Corynebacterium imitans]|uniref:TetR/AcrR family transcriptional regulator n=1 Tax=Corynebacterium imitans TaxID=156978 RepID=UPI001EF33983|nr:TetR/AcrR family transcriptional regulator [Corynebacterium imitans]MCG7279227.1 TetR/AcrR family transcriptional regulator [Corynebacterium imitans]
MARREGSMDPRAVRTRGAFLNATRELQLENKTEDITVSAIVKRAGMSRQVFYEHYDGRDAVVGALIEHTFRPVIDAYIKEYIESDNPRAAIDVLVGGMYEERDLLLNVVGGPALPAVLEVFTTPEQPMLRNAVDSLQERLGKIDQQYQEDLGDLLRAGAFRLMVKSVREAGSAAEAADRVAEVLGILRKAF